MAKTSSVEKQKRREKYVKINWEKRAALRDKAVDMKATEEERFAARIALNKMRRDTSPSRLKNRCLLTGRTHGYLRKFKVSRLCFREMASRGMIPGVVKASW